MSEHDNDAVLESDPLTAPVVRRIFEEYVGGRGLQAIAERLTADGVLRPSAYDAQRNPHHVGSAWSKAAVRAIITNHRYAAQHAHVLPAECPRCRRRCATRHQMALVPVEVYRQAQDILAVRGDMPNDDRSRKQPADRYMLRGLLRCELCQRLMQGTWNNDMAYYRCRFPREYAKANNIDHPPNVYVREGRLVVPLQNWIYQSLPIGLHEWAGRQSPVIRIRLKKRIDELRELIVGARRDRAQRIELYRSLGVRLVYEPGHNIVQVRSEVLPGAVVMGNIRL